MKKIIKKSLVGGLVFSLTILMVGITYAAITHVNSGESLTALKFNEVIAVTSPTGEISAFYLSLCPTGWILADGTNSTPDLRGTFIRGDNGEGNGRDVSRTLGDYQLDDFKGHRHPLKQKTDAVNDYLGGSVASYGLDTTGDGGSIEFAVGLAGGSETRPKNVALLYCMKQ